MRHLLSMTDLKPAEIEKIFAISEDLKTKYQQGLREPILPGRVLAMIFEKPSLRTRVSFESAMINLGGNSLFLGEDTGWGNRESLADFGRVLGEYVDVLVVRSHDHKTVEELRNYCARPVINGLTDYEHPCQVLADLYTLKECVGRLRGHTLAYIGDGNNVARSLALACGKLGVKFVMATPKAYRFDADFEKVLRVDVPDLELVVTDDPAEAVTDATAVYTDVWTSMGQEKESAQRKRDFAAYQINEKLMAHAPAGAYFMHCLPAHRGEEVTNGVIDGPQSIVVQQAGNRMHVQKGILAWLLSRPA
jgi:ornithine carbamoyltransferase